MLIVVTVIALLGLLMIKNSLSGAKRSGVESTRILVAKRDMTQGAFIKAGVDIDWQEPTAEQKELPNIREGSFKKNDFNGGVVRKAIKAGSAVTPDQVTKAGDGGFLSAVLEPGMRAVAIAVTATTGAAGFIAPGDRVDLIVTHRMKAPRDNNSQDTVLSETFVRDVRVVAVDQSIDTPENKASIAKNVTVEVNESQAEQISVASEMGKISLALRSSVPDDASVVNRGGQFTRDSDVSPVLGRKEGMMPRVQVIRGNEKEDLQFMGQGQ
jgi:pilus assembly protein CpaB